jgi:hypothetical protein
MNATMPLFAIPTLFAPTLLEVTTAVLANLGTMELEQLVAVISTNVS